MTDREMLKLAIESEYITTLEPALWLALGLRGLVKRERDDDKGRARFRITLQGISAYHELVRHP